MNLKEKRRETSSVKTITNGLLKDLNTMMPHINRLIPNIIPLFDILIRLEEIKTRRIQLEAEIKHLTIISNEVLNHIRTIIGTRTEERKKILDVLLAAFNQFVDKYEADKIIQIGRSILELLDKPIITEEEVSALVGNLLKSRKYINNDGDYNDETIYI